MGGVIRRIVKNHGSGLIRAHTFRCRTCVLISFRIILSRSYPKEDARRCAFRSEETTRRSFLRALSVPPRTTGRGFRKPTRPAGRRTAALVTGSRS
jgi:hypothetical protein